MVQVNLQEYHTAYIIQPETAERSSKWRFRTEAAKHSAQLLQTVTDGTILKSGHILLGRYLSKRLSGNQAWKIFATALSIAKTKEEHRDKEKKQNGAKI